MFAEVPRVLEVAPQHSCMPSAGLLESSVIFPFLSTLVSSHGSPLGLQSFQFPQTQQ